MHQLQTGTTHVLKIALTNVPPDVAGHTVLADIGELPTGGGYTAGGQSVGVLTGSQTGGVFTLTGSHVPVWTASGAGFTARYAVLYNATPTAPDKPLIGYWDRGSSVALDGLNGDVFRVNLDLTSGLLTLGDPK